MNIKELNRIIEDVPDDVEVYMNVYCDPESFSGNLIEVCEHLDDVCYCKMTQRLDLTIEI